MKKCAHCGGRLVRVHRAFFERFRYLALYRCHDCQREDYAPRYYRYHLGPHSRCPRCGTYRLVRLKARDRIDRMHTGLLNFFERLAGGRLHHCCYCRLQFYDRRSLAADAGHAMVSEPHTVHSDA
jgi:hydrogenase maturation factor HypF (carbamoyltransferase family)